MDTLLLVARVLLSIVFLVAGLSKLVDISGSREAVQNFGISSRLAPLLGTLLPFGEIVTAILLLFQLTAWWGAICASLLLLLFVIGITVNLIHGRQPKCHCFGQLHSAPAGKTTLTRNILLLILAGLIIVQGRYNPGASILDWLTELRAIEAISLFIAGSAIIVASVTGWFLLHVLQQQGRLQLRLEGLETILNEHGIMQAQSEDVPRGLSVGTSAPDFELPDLQGKTESLAELRQQNRPVLLMFSDPNCGPCNALMPDVARWQQDFGSQLNLVVISRGTIDQNRAKATEHKIGNILIQHDQEVAEAYESYGTPSALLIHQSGKIASSIAMGAAEIRKLIETTVTEPTMELSHL